MTDDENATESLPKTALDFIDTVVKKVRYRKKIRQEVCEELTDHFYMALKDFSTDEEKLQAVDELIAEFGDVTVLASLIRRGKKRCRPLWKKAVFVAMKVVGVLLLLVVLRVGYLSIGTTVISVDYVEWLNDFVRDGRDESLNAYPYYERAVELGKIEVPESLDAIIYEGLEITDENIEDARAYVKEMKPAFDELRKGASMPYAWPQYKIDSSLVSDIKVSSENRLDAELIPSIIPFMRDAKSLVLKMSQLEISVKLYEGDIEGAMDDSLVIVEFGRDMTGKGLLLEQLVGIAVQAIGIEHINNAIQNKNISASALNRCQKHMELIGKGPGQTFDINAEKVFIFDYIQHTFTDDGAGNGRALLKGLSAVAGNNKELVSGFILWDYPDRRDVIESTESFYEDAEMIMNVPPWQLSGSELETVESSMLEDSVFLVRVANSSFFKIRFLPWRLISERRATITLCAVLRYEKDKGQFPTDLKVLVNGGYLKELPIDPFSGKAFVYRVTKESFILYSLGTDMDDDGGVPYIYSNGGRERKWGDDSGDSIFWPALNRE